MRSNTGILHYFRTHHPSWTEGILESMIGLLVYCGLFHGTIALLQRRTALASGDMYEVANKLVSSVFATLTCALAIRVYSECGQDLLHERHHLIRHYMCFAVFYFLYDTYAMFLVYRTNDVRATDQALSYVMLKQFVSQRPLMVAHHLVLPLVLFPIFMSFDTGLGDCLLALAFLMELSTPLVSARKVLSVLGLKNSVWYCINGALMTLVFFACRVLILPVLVCQFAAQLGVSGVEAVIHHIPWFCSLATLLIWLPQLYWWWLMVAGCAKVIQKYALVAGKQL